MRQHSSFPSGHIELLRRGREYAIIRRMKRLIVVLALLGVAASVTPVERIVLDNHILVLTAKFEQMQQRPDKRIPAELLQKAQGLVLMERTKAGFIFAFQGGGGVAMVREPKSGRWGPAAFVRASEASLGVQIGGQHSFIVMLLMTTNATRLLAGPSFEFGGEARGTAGDSSAGEESGVSTREQAMLLYNETSGLYGGAVLKGGAFTPDTKANLAYYGESLTMADILFEQKVRPTKAAIQLAGKCGEPDRPSLPTPAAPAPVPAVPVLTIKSNVAVEQLQLLLSDLNANKQTNALRHLNSYLTAMITTQHMADADVTVSVLERLRATHTAEAIDLLELQLDGALIGVADALRGAHKKELAAAPLNTLQRAREYRAKFPHKSGDPNIDEGVARAFGLLEQRK